jgi:hypothetical protein
MSALSSLSGAGGAMVIDRQAALPGRFTCLDVTRPHLKCEKPEESLLGFCCSVRGRHGLPSCALSYELTTMVSTHMHFNSTLTLVVFLPRYCNG